MFGGDINYSLSLFLKALLGSSLVPREVSMFFKKKLKGPTLLIYKIYKNHRNLKMSIKEKQVYKYNLAL